MKLKSRSKNPLLKRARKGFRGYPVATIALYGPDDRRATKVAVGIVTREERNLTSWKDGSPLTGTSVLTMKSHDRFARSWPTIMSFPSRQLTASSDVPMRKVLIIQRARFARNVRFGPAAIALPVKPFTDWLLRLPTDAPTKSLDASGGSVFLN
jgi:hypothetical protein